MQRLLRLGVVATAGGRQVVLTGRYVCGPFSPDSDGVVDLTVVQEAGAVDTTGYGYLYLTVCDGSAQVWSAPVDSVGGQFVRGRAQASGSGYACDRGPGGGCAFARLAPPACESASVGRPDFSRIVDVQSLFRMKSIHQHSGGFPGKTTGQTISSPRSPEHAA